LVHLHGAGWCAAVIAPLDDENGSLHLLGVGNR
jgi:hypothetical protein